MLKQITNFIKQLTQWQFFSQNKSNISININNILLDNKNINKKNPKEKLITNKEIKENSNLCNENKKKYKKYKECKDNENNNVEKAKIKSRL